MIAAACRDSERVRFAYRGRDGAASRREVEPHSLVNLGRRWYLVAWDRGREDWRTFRVDRLVSARPRPACASHRASCRPRTPRRTSPSASPPRRTATRRGYAARVGRGGPPARPAHWGDDRADRRARRCEYRTGDDDLDWLALRIAMLGVDFEVHEPPELREHMLMLAERYRGAAGIDDGA